MWKRENLWAILDPDSSLALPEEKEDEMPRIHGGQKIISDPLAEYEKDALEKKIFEKTNLPNFVKGFWNDRCFGIHYGARRNCSIYQKPRQEEQ